MTCAYEIARSLTLVERAALKALPDTSGVKLPRQVRRYGADPLARILELGLATRWFVRTDLGREVCRQPGIWPEPVRMPSGASSSAEVGVP